MVIVKYRLRIIRKERPMNTKRFILNAIHSRDNCFFYIKEIVKGESYILLSSEEMDALRQAVHFGENKVR